MAEFPQSAASRIILDLCGGRRNWSWPYIKAGYDVRVVTLPYSDVRTYQPPKNVYGILVASPCTAWASSGAWVKRSAEEWHEAIEIVQACQAIIKQCQPHFWAWENPVGRLALLLGKPAMYFQPYDYGDPWTKKTALWGRFRPPFKSVLIEPVGSWAGSMHRSPAIRAATPPGFARAFFEANR